MSCDLVEQLGLISCRIWCCIDRLCLRCRVCKCVGCLHRKNRCDHHVFLRERRHTCSYVPRTSFSYPGRQKMLDGHATTRSHKEDQDPLTSKQKARHGQAGLGVDCAPATDNSCRNSRYRGMPREAPSASCKAGNAAIVPGRIGEAVQNAQMQHKMPESGKLNGNRSYALAQDAFLISQVTLIELHSESCCNEPSPG